MHSNGMNVLARQCEDSENLIRQFIDVYKVYSCVCLFVCSLGIYELSDGTNLRRYSCACVHSVLNSCALILFSYTLSFAATMVARSSVSIISLIRFFASPSLDSVLAVVACPRAMQRHTGRYRMSRALE